MPNSATAPAAPPAKRRRWPRRLLVAGGFVLGTIGAVLGNILANYLQDAWRLTDPARVTFVVVPFAVCVAGGLAIALRLSVEEAREEAVIERPASLEPRTRTPGAHTLRAPVADFTGRTQEIDDLLSRLTTPGAAALISGIHGMGGVGKTELALVVARRLARHYPDAQLLIELQPGGAPLSGEALLGQAIHAFWPEAKLPGTLAELQALYRAALQGRRGLLVLDNAADGAQVRPLLPPPAGWAVLVTSRQRFALPGGWTLDLDVLPEADAHALLRSLLKEGGRAATDEEVARLAGLCGYLPLALRLAAGYLVSYRDRPVDEYLAALEQERLPRLAVGGESVAAILGLSVSRLEQVDAALALRWRQLGVFPAPFDRAAAAEVWELGGEETRTALSTLCQQSLVEYDEPTASYSLHDLLREYALQPPAPADDLALRLRHAAHYLAVAARADDLYDEGGEHVLEGLRLFDGVWPHLEAAWGWLRAREDEASARWLSDFAGRMPNMLDLRLTPGQRIPILEAALAAARRLGDRRGEGTALGNLGLAYAALGDAGRAIELYEQALAIDREIGDRRGEGIVCWNMGLAYERLGEHAKAAALMQVTVDFERGIGHPDAEKDARHLEEVRRKAGLGAADAGGGPGKRRGGRRSC